MTTRASPSLFGVNVRLAKVAAFTVGGMLMGLGGALYGHHYNYIEAQSFNVLLSIYILLYVLLGRYADGLGAAGRRNFLHRCPRTHPQPRNRDRVDLARG